MTASFSHCIGIEHEVARGVSHRWRHLLAVCVAVLWGMIGVGTSQHLSAQSGDPAGDPGAVIPPAEAPDYCQDSCCRTEVLLLNTGYNHAASGIYPVGVGDDYWTIVADQDPSRPVPRPANVIASTPPWSGAMPNTQWIGPNSTSTDRFIGQVTYEKCFCVCGPDESELTFSLDVLVDDSASIYLDGVYMGSTPNLSFVTPVSVDFTKWVGPGRHCLDVVVDNAFVILSGLDIRGTVQGSGLVKYSCCGPVIPPDPCVTDSLALATGPGWDLISGPDYAGPYPRCADVIDPAYGGWGAPTPGTSWIGPNPTGQNQPDEVYVYRKCFCVKQDGWFLLDFTTMADAQADVSINGTYLFSVPNPGWHSPVYNTVRVALAAGCNCIEYKVIDPGGLVTGLDALVEISGGLLLRPECCDCGFCREERGKVGARPETGNDAAHGAEVSAMRPMLLSIPNPTTGDATVHYVIDQDADTRVDLYDAAGRHVLTVDQGARTRGEHVVPVATKGLSSGAYRLQLKFGERTLTIPLNVQ